MQGEEVCKSDSRKHLTGLESRFIVVSTMRSADVVTALEQQLDTDVEQIGKDYDEMEKLRSAYIKYKNLEEQTQQIKSRIKDTLALVAPENYMGSGMDDDKFITITERVGIAEGVNDLRKELPLWAAMTQVLRHASELQVVNLQEILQFMNIQVSRQAIESALETHKELFRVKKRGREKFVSLK